MKKLLIYVSLLAALMTPAVLAETKPFNLSLVPDIAIYDRTTRIDGLTLSLWGENPQTSLALGVINGATGNSSGLHLAWLANYADNFEGAQLGAINYVNGNLRGLQLGFVNYAGNLSGLQLGFVNYAENAVSGVQIGFINIIIANDQWFAGLPEELAPAMVFANWRF